MLQPAISSAGHWLNSLLLQRGQKQSVRTKELRSNKSILTTRATRAEKWSPIFHTGKSVFEGLPSPFTATRYHSLIVKRDTLPDCLEITAETENGTIMGLMHKELPIHGVQFHPESILTEDGMKMLENFLRV